MENNIIKGASRKSCCPIMEAIKSE